MLSFAYLGEQSAIAASYHPKLVDAVHHLLAEWREVVYLVRLFEEVECELISLIAWLEARAVPAVMADVERRVALWRVAEHFLLWAWIGIVDASELLGCLEQFCLAQYLVGRLCKDLEGDGKAYQYCKDLH